jgi:hypothetical protein
LSTSQTREALTPISDGLSRRAAVLRLGAGGLGGALLGGGLLAASAQEATPEAGQGGEFLAIRQYTFAPGHAMGELAEAVHSGFMPIVSQVPGFVEYYLVETEEGALSISVFTDQAGAEESTKRAADWVADALAGFFDGPPTVTTGTVRIHE